MHADKITLTDNLFGSKQRELESSLTMSESDKFSSSFGVNVSFDRETCGNLTEDYKKVLI